LNTKDVAIPELESLLAKLPQDSPVIAEIRKLLEDL
jgi:hypothetical protein